VLVVGLDLGTQSLKAVVCDERLVVRGKHSVPITTSFPSPGGAEQDPRAWEAALAPAIGGALAKANATAADVIAIAIVGQLDGCIAVDAACTPLHPALIWQDRRAIEDAARAPAKQVFGLTGQVADPSHLAPKAAWLRGHGIAAARFHQPVSYLVERLTGAAVLDLSLASTCMLLELSSEAWAPVLLEAFELESSQLPAIRPTCAIAGALTTEGATLTGLAPGTRVAVGTGDDFANPLGAGITSPGSIAVTLGTAEVVGTVARELLLDSATEPMVETHAYPSGGFFIENPGWLSGGAIEWAVKLIGVADAAALDALAATVPPGAEGVTFVPALAGAMTPVWRPHARGTFHGLAPSHGREHLARAVLEGLAFACRDVVERLAILGLAGDRVVLVGGGAHSPLWAQIRADVIGLPHEVVANPDTSPVGAAMIASVAAGMHTDLAAAAALVTPRHVDYAPGNRLDDAYGRYRRLIGQLLPLSETRWE
jgi:xylulokinase